MQTQSEAIFVIGEQIGWFYKSYPPMRYYFEPLKPDDQRFAQLAGRVFGSAEVLKQRIEEAARENASGQAGEINNNYLEFSHATGLRKLYRD